MKKVIAILLIFVLSTMFTTISNAEIVLLSNSNVSSTGVLKDIKCYPGITQDKIVIPLDSYKGYKFMRLTKPNRIAVDIPNTVGPSSQIKVDMNGSIVKSVRYAMNDTKNTKITRVVLDVIGQPKYFVEEGKGQLIIYVVNQLSRNLGYYTDNNTATLVVNGAKFTSGLSTSAKLFTGQYDATGKKYTLTFLSSLADVDSKKISVQDSFIDYISIIKDVSTKKTSIIFYAKDKFLYNIESKSDVNGSEIKISKNSEVGRGGDDVRVNTDFNVKYSLEGSLDKISILNTVYTGYVTSRCTDPDRIVLDIPNTDLPVIENQIDVNSTRVKAIRYAQYAENTIRVVVDLNGQYQFHTEEKEGELALYIEDPTYTNFEYSNDGKTVCFNLKGIMLLGGTNNSIKLYTESFDTSGKIYTVTFPGNLGNIGSGILQINDNSFDSVVILYDSNANQTTITFNAKAGFNYNTSNTFDGTSIIVTNQISIKNMKYYNGGDRIHFIISKAKLTEAGKGLIKHFTASYNGNNYTITFSSKLTNLSAGFMNINDNYLDSVSIVNDSTSGNTSITFNAKDKFIYEVIYRDITDDTAIDIIKPVTKQDKLVVIDAGHGGIEPGAVYAGVKEETLNLDIALRLNALLKSKGIKTYMTREDDSYVGLYERAYIANDLNASLFLCVHNNAYTSSSNGTETLYYGNCTRDSFNCKTFAQIIQNNLIATLNTFNLGIIPRPELVVLNTTKMPAALAEVAFITNDGDRGKLLTDDFKQRAAQALCDSVVQSLSKLN